MLYYTFIELTRQTQFSFNSPADGQLTHVLYNLYSFYYFRPKSIHNTLHLSLALNVYK